MSARVIVTGAGGPAGRALLAALDDRGVRAVGVDMEPATQRVNPTPYIVERVPPAVSTAFIPALLDIARRHGAGFVIPTVSEELPILATSVETGEWPTQGPVVVIGSADAVRCADDKWLTMQALAAAHVSTPLTVLACIGLFDAVPTLAFPLLSKPRCGRGARGVMVHWTAETLAEIPPEHVVQEFVDGEEYIVDAFIADAPERDVFGVLVKTELASGIIGNATGVRRVDEDHDRTHDDVASVAVAAARAIGLAGPVDVDVRRRASGEPVVLEINARFGAHSSHVPQVLDALLCQWAVETVRS